MMIVQRSLFLSLASLWLLAVSLPTACEAAAPASNSPGNGDRPNILFIFVDDLGFGDLGVFFQNQRAAAGDRSKPWHQTPALDRLAAEGIQLPHHYCPAPVCAPSRASLLLGVHQGHANVRDNQFDKALEANHTLATMLQTAGYATAAIGKYGLQGGQEQDEAAPPRWPAHPNRRGFEYYFGYMRHRDGHEHYPKEGLHRGQKQVWENTTDVSSGLDLCYTTDLFTAKTKHYITQHVKQSPDKPFFVYLAYDTPHAVLSLPTQAYPAGGGLNGGLQWLGQPGKMINTASGTPDSYYHPDYAEATWDHDADPATAEQPWPDVQKRYATVVRRIDDCVADLMSLLKDLQIDDNTLIVFTNDNGPSVESYLPENYQPTFFQGYGPYAGIKRDLWEGGVHVGGLARWPARIPAGSTSGDTPTAFWDWMPTFAEVAGFAPPARTDGVSLLPILTGRPDERAPSTVYIEYFQNGRTPQFADFDRSLRNRRRNQMQLLREGNYVGVRYDIQSQDDDFAIFDIVQDPGQTKNLAAQLPEIQQRFKQRSLRVRRPNASARRPYDEALVPALGSIPSEPGVVWHAARGSFPWVPQLSERAADQSGVADHPEQVAELASGSTSEDDAQRAWLISGLLEVPLDGEYTLSLSTPGRALVRLHEATLLDADAGYRRGETVTGNIRLAAGKHAIRIYHLADSAVQGQPSLSLSWSGPGVEAGPIPAAAFSRPVKGQ